MKLQFELNGTLVKLYAQKIGSKLWIHRAGNTFVVDLEESSSARSKKTKHHGPHTGEILAPMPGKVTKIFKAAGEAVRKGDALLVMEAMKMEYTLKAEGNGKVEQIECAVGEQVVLGKLLIKIKPEVVSG